MIRSRVVIVGLRVVTSGSPRSPIDIRPPGRRKIGAGRGGGVDPSVARCLAPGSAGGAGPSAGHVSLVHLTLVCRERRKHLLLL